MNTSFSYACIGESLADAKNLKVNVPKTKPRAEGGFSAVAHEMTEKLMRMDLTSREHRLVWFFSREILGYGLKEKIIKTAKIVQSTGMYKQHVHSALNSLMGKGVIERFEVDGLPGEYLYRFNERLFERVHATKVVKESYVEDGKVIHLKHYKKPKQLPLGDQPGYPVVTASVTINPPVVAIVADTNDFKEILKKEKEILSFKGQEPEKKKQDKSKTQPPLQPMASDRSEDRLGGGLGLEGIGLSLKNWAIRNMERQRTYSEPFC